MKQHKKLKTVFFGTPDFSVPSLELLANHSNIELVSVVSMPDRPSGRGQNVKSPEVIQFAKQAKINFFQTENINKEKEFIETLKNQQIDLFIVLAFAQFLGEELLELPTLGCFNIHTSLLPKYRGAAPIQYALLNGDTSTGVSIQKMVKKMDAGDLALSSPIEISPTESGGQLYTRLKFQAALSLNDFILNTVEEKIEFVPQDESKVTFAPTLKKEDGFLSFKDETYENIFNKLRAFDPWPGIYFFLDKKRVKVFEIEKSLENLQPGQMKLTSTSILIGCQDSTLSLLTIQIEGKKKSKASAIVNGLDKNTRVNP